MYFCGLYYDLKKYIIRRSIKDIDGNFSIEDTTIMDDNNQEKDDENIFNCNKKVSELTQKKNNNI